MLQIKLVALCCLKIHKWECLLVSGYQYAFVSSSYLGAATVGFLGDSMYFLFFLTEVTAVSVFRGRVVAVLLGKSQTNLCTAHMDASVCHSSSPPFEEDTSKQREAAEICQLVKFQFSEYEQSFGSLSVK